MDRSSKQKINNEMMALNDTLDQMGLTDIFRTFPLKAVHPKEYTFFLTYIFPRVDHILGHKSGLNKYKKTEIIPCIFSDYSAMKLEVNHKKTFRKTTNTWRLKNILVKNEWVGAPGWLSWLSVRLLLRS